MKIVQTKSGGGAGLSGLRTSFGISITLGVPLPQYNLAPFVTAPFRHTLKMMMALSPEAHNKSHPVVLAKHPIWKVLGWQHRLDSDDKLTKVEIAQREGVSKSRMTQMFRLLNLPKKALSYLKNQNTPD